MLTKPGTRNAGRLGHGFAGILVSDRYGAYAWVDARHRQLCWAPLLRGFTRMSERSGASGRIGDELLALAKRMSGWRGTAR